MQVTLTKSQEWMSVYAQVVSDSWINPQLKQRLLEAPERTILEEYNFQIPSDVSVSFKMEGQVTPNSFDIFNNQNKKFEFLLSDSPEGLDMPDINGPKSPDDNGMSVMACCCCCM